MNQTMPPQTAAQILEEILECLSIDCPDIPKKIELAIKKNGDLVVKETFLLQKKSIHTIKMENWFLNLMKL